MVAGPILAAVRAAYPRTVFVPDHVLLEAVVAAQRDLEALPADLLSSCFSGLTRLHVAAEHNHGPASDDEVRPVGAASTVRTVGACLRTWG